MSIRAGSETKAQAMGDKSQAEGDIPRVMGDNHESHRRWKRFFTLSARSKPTCFD